MVQSGGLDSTGLSAKVALAEFKLRVRSSSLDPLSYKYINDKGDSLGDLGECLAGKKASRSLASYRSGIKGEVN